MSLRNPRKGFDKVCRQKLLEKVEARGVVGNALIFFESYLTDRRHGTTVNEKSCQKL